VRVTFQRSHIDRMPLGDLPSTFLSLLVAHPEVSWKFDYSLRPASGDPPEVFAFDDHPVKELLGDLPLTEPSILAYLRGLFEEGLGQKPADTGIARFEKSM